MRKTYNLKKTSTSIVREIMNVLKDYQNLVCCFSKLSQYLKLLLVKDRRERKL